METQTKKTAKQSSWDIECSLCKQKHSERFCPNCGYCDQPKEKEKQGEIMNEFFIQKAFEGYDAKIKVLESKIEDLEKVLTNMTVGIQAVHFQTEAMMHILIDKKGIVDEQEAKDAVDELYARMQAAQNARELGLQQEQQKETEQVEGEG
jgi:hypothetical protein